MHNFFHQHHNTYIYIICLYIIPLKKLEDCNGPGCTVSWTWDSLDNVENMESKPTA